MARKPSGKPKKRKGISLLEFHELFPNEDAARRWFEGVFWPDGKPICGHCGSDDAYATPSGKPQPYRCRACKQYFSVRIGTVLADSRLPLLKWLMAIYLDCSSLKGVASHKLHRDLKVTQKTAWHMQHRIREGWRGFGPRVLMDGPVEVDETYMGGKRRNMHHRKRKTLEGRGTVGKSIVLGIKDRKSNQVAGRVVRRADLATIQRFVYKHADWLAPIFTDGASAFKNLPNHQSVAHSRGEYVRGRVHTNGVESFWSMLKRAHKGTFHKMSGKHLQRYVDEFAGRHNVRPLDTIVQMSLLTRGLFGKKLPYEDLIAETPIAATAPAGAAAASGGVRKIPAQ